MMPAKKLSQLSITDNKNEMAKKKEKGAIKNVWEIKKNWLIHFLGPTSSTKRQRPLAAELLNEIFASMPLEYAFYILAGVPNALLATNVRRRHKNALTANKWDLDDCGSNLQISKNGRGVSYKNVDEEEWKSSVRAKFPASKLILSAKKPSYAFYFEVQILKKTNMNIAIGLCDQKFLLENNYNNKWENSIWVWGNNGICHNGSFVHIENNDSCICSKIVEGDVKGIGLISANSSLKCFSTFNGIFVGAIELPPKFAGLKLFPAVTLWGERDLIKANFDKKEWLYNPSKNNDF